MLAVVWTDFLQSLLMVLFAVITAGFLCAKVRSAPSGSWILFCVVFPCYPLSTLLFVYGFVLPSRKGGRWRWWHLGGPA